METHGVISEGRSRSKEKGNNSFWYRHIGPAPEEISSMVKTLGASNLDSFVASVVPSSIRTSTYSLSRYAGGLSEKEALNSIGEFATRNTVCRSYIGMGYYGTIVPGVIQRNILENPGWYTQYTPYQPEISQGRLEALLNFQTMVSDLTGLDVSNASLLDEGTAAAEAMTMSHAIATKDGDRNTFLISDECHPQTIDVVKTRAKPLGFKVVVAPVSTWEITKDVFGVLLQYPGTTGVVEDYSEIISKAKAAGALVTVATDLLALCLLISPGELGADIAVGSAQRFGVPFGFGGPHAAFFATKDEHKRLMPGRLVGVSKDARGKHALRLSLQTREQHIRREKATSNICTAQVLLAIMASMYAVYHGPKGLKAIASTVHERAKLLASGLKARGYTLKNDALFDTVVVTTLNGSSAEIKKRAQDKGINLRHFENGSVGISVDEDTSESDIEILLSMFGAPKGKGETVSGIPSKLQRKSAYLTHPVFSMYHSETECLRYIKRLEARDLSLAGSMIPLGSCTMKLNATTEMVPVTWKEFNSIHPFAPSEQWGGYRELFSDLETLLCEVTGFDAVSLQPNAGSQGEYAGLLVIRAFQEAKGELHRDVCLIPKSAHGTNPASAVMAGLKVIVVECDNQGNIDVTDLRAKAETHKDKLSCLMVTYPSTHGVFEESIKEISEIIHKAGGQVYLDGANLNALVGLVKPAEIGADVCHINLHKTFCIPHGGGGPGMGPIGVRSHLAPYLPGHPLVAIAKDNSKRIGPISAAPWGSASILPISWAYMVMMGEEGMALATKVAILNANYIAKRLEGHYPVLYKGKNGLVAHECILDLRELKTTAGVEVDDVAKRLMDYGIHAPTVSWPVPGTMMVEPTESESKFELDRFCDAMISIRNEARKIEKGELDKTDNPLKNAPHTVDVVVSDSWNRKYSRELAAFPTQFTKDHKFWPSVGRVDASYGDRNLVCSCPPIEDY